MSDTRPLRSRPDGAGLAQRTGAAESGRRSRALTRRVKNAPYVWARCRHTYGSSEVRQKKMHLAPISGPMGRLGRGVFCEGEANAKGRLGSSVRWRDVGAGVRM